jgi:hypothetical protein
MNNLQRLQMEVKGIALTDDEWNVYLLENGLTPTEVYDASSIVNKKKLYQTALSVLESIANSPTSMKDYKIDDMTVSQFHENLMARIDQLQNKIDNLRTDEVDMRGQVFSCYMETKGRNECLNHELSFNIKGTSRARCLAFEAPF